MNIISLSSDLLKILQEQISILNSILSLKKSLEKLISQKNFTEKWSEVGITCQPKELFCEAIDSKAKLIQTELKTLRYNLIENLLFYYYYYYCFCYKGVNR